MGALPGVLIATFASPVSNRLDRWSLLQAWETFWHYVYRVSTSFFTRPNTRQVRRPEQRRVPGAQRGLLPAELQRGGLAGPARPRGAPFLACSPRCLSRLRIFFRVSLAMLVRCRVFCIPVQYCSERFSLVQGCNSFGALPPLRLPSGPSRLRPAPSVARGSQVQAMLDPQEAFVATRYYGRLDALLVLLSARGVLASAGARRRNER